MKNCRTCQAFLKITQKTSLKNDMCRSSGSMREHKKHPVDRLCFSPDYVRKIVVVLKRVSSVFCLIRECFVKKRAFFLRILRNFVEKIENHENFRDFQKER